MVRERSKAVNFALEQKASGSVPADAGIAAVSFNSFNDTHAKLNESERIRTNPNESERIRTNMKESERI
jgi:hypothetical protein